MSNMYIKTAEEAKNDCVLKMGKDIGETYAALWQEVAWLYTKWRQYVVLYGTKASRIDLLNEAASAFFRLIQDSLWEDVTLHLARLTDSPKSMGKENLSVRRLALFSKGSVIESEVQTELDKVLDTTEFCRDWRNRRIAHKDLILALDRGAQPLASASRASVKEALETLSAFLNVFSKHYLGTTNYFDPIDTNGALDLLYVIDDGLKLAGERRDRLQRGDPRESDWRPRDL
jgi:hypothetical protein